ncbi:predicted protein [Nematostella vectensis]|uniref:MANSC domain-containing protein n=1 Tax=Nematostella vectensis TaxID=45351 RepID=A7RWP2_NEMVE|nr:predicted protein [Nematostella vectensis]|eukprot:XP_001636264.1 predicted protein [Nematostella vectensis]
MLSKNKIEIIAMVLVVSCLRICAGGPRSQLDIYEDIDGDDDPYREDIPRETIPNVGMSEDHGYLTRIKVIPTAQPIATATDIAMSSGSGEENGQGKSEKVALEESSSDGPEVLGESRNEPTSPWSPVSTPNTAGGITGQDRAPIPPSSSPSAQPPTTTSTTTTTTAAIEGAATTPTGTEAVNVFEESGSPADPLLLPSNKTRSEKAIKVEGKSDNKTQPTTNGIDLLQNQQTNDVKPKEGSAKAEEIGSVIPNAGMTSGSEPQSAVSIVTANKDVESLRVGSGETEEQLNSEEEHEGADEEEEEEEKDLDASGAKEDKVEGQDIIDEDKTIPESHTIHLHKPPRDDKQDLHGNIKENGEQEKDHEKAHDATELSHYPASARPPPSAQALNKTSEQEKEHEKVHVSTGSNHYPASPAPLPASPTAFNNKTRTEVQEEGHELTGTSTAPRGKAQHKTIPIKRKPKHAGKHRAKHRSTVHENAAFKQYHQTPKKPKHLLKYIHRFAKVSSKAPHNVDRKPPSCDHNDEDVKTGYSLKGGTRAGHVIQLGKSAGMHECVKRCCHQHACDVALLLDGRCFGVACFSKHLCEPVPVPHPQFVSSQIAFLDKTSRRDDIIPQQDFGCQYGQLSLRHEETWSGELCGGVVVCRNGIASIKKCPGLPDKPKNCANPKLIVNHHKGQCCTMRWKCKEKSCRFGGRILRHGFSLSDQLCTGVVKCVNGNLKMSYCPGIPAKPTNCAHPELKIITRPGKCCKKKWVCADKSCSYENLKIGHGERLTDASCANIMECNNGFLKTHQCPDPPPIPAGCLNPSLKVKRVLGKCCRMSWACAMDMR